MRYRLALLLVSGIAIVISLALVVQSYRRANVPLHTTIVPSPFPHVGQSVLGLAFSPNGRTLALADSQGGLALWDDAPLRQRRTLRTMSNADFSDVSFFAETPDGRLLAIGDGNRAGVWDAATGVRLEAVTEIPPRTPPSSETDYYGLHIVSRKASLAAGGQTNGTITVWDLNTGRRLWSAPGKSARPYQGTGENLCGLAFSPDEKQLAVATLIGDDRFPSWRVDFVLRDARTGREERHWNWSQFTLWKITSFRGNLDNIGLAWSPNGRLLAAAGPSDVLLGEVDTGRLLRTLTLGAKSAYYGPKKVLFFPDGHRLTAAGWGKDVPVWNVDTGRRLQVFQGPDAVQALAVSPSGTRLAVGGQGRQAQGILQIWDTAGIK